MKFATAAHKTLTSPESFSGIHCQSDQRDLVGPAKEQSDFLILALYHGTVNG